MFCYYWLLFLCKYQLAKDVWKEVKPVVACDAGGAVGGAAAGAVAGGVGAGPGAAVGAIGASAGKCVEEIVKRI